MTRRVVIGSRANGNVGLFVSPPGVDAFTAPDSTLIMNVTSKVSQLILFGTVGGSSTVIIGQTQRPIVFITSQYSFSDIIGHTAGPGPVRPSPFNGSGASANASVASDGSLMVISAPAQVFYYVYSSVF
jgi:hypothetical protein